MANTVLRQARNALQAAAKTHLPAVLATLIVVAICIFGQPLYDGNDDPGIAMVGAGFGEAAHPEPHLVWCHYGYGLILAALSKFIGPNAHGWITIVSIWFSLVLLIQAAFRSQNLAVRISVLLACVGAVYMRALLAAEFTITAALLFGGAVTRWLTRTDQEGTDASTTIIIIGAVVLGYMIRPESYAMGMVVITPALMFLCWGRRPSVVRPKLSALTLILIFGLGFVTDNLAYRTSTEWREVPEYNELRAQFNDFRRVHWHQDAPEYKEVGWTFNDYWMFLALYSRDPIYRIENISLLVNKLGVSRGTTALAQMRDWISYPFSDWPLLLILSAQVVILLLLPNDQRLVGLLFLVGEAGAITLTALIGKLAIEGSHVWFSASAITLMCLSACLVLAPPIKKSALSIVGAVLIGALGLSAASLVWFQHQEYLQEARMYRAWIDQNRDELKGKVTVWGVGLRWECLITPTRIYPPFPELKVAAIDDLNHMPVETAMLEELGIDDLARELGTDPGMHLICPKRLITPLAKFCQQHYGISPIFRETAHWGDSAIYCLDTR